MYKIQYHSLVKWTKDFIKGLPTPAEYVNFDTAAQATDLPKVDVVGTSDYAIARDGVVLSAFLGWTISTWNDPDLTRMVDIMDRLAEELKPGVTLPLWQMDGSQMKETSWLVLTDDIDIEPVMNDKHRSYVSLTARMVSGLSGR